MVTVRYLDGAKEICVEVTEEFAASYAEMERKEALIERKETRRHQSLDKSLDNGFDFPDGSLSPEEAVIAEEEKEKLYIALSRLQPSQRELIYKVYFKDETMADIAAEIGIDASSVRHRMIRSLTSLKKFYFETATFGDSRGY